MRTARNSRLSLTRFLPSSLPGDYTSGKVSKGLTVLPIKAVDTCV
jgi:hypothetical protein